MLSVKRLLLFFIFMLDSQCFNFFFFFFNDPPPTEIYPLPLHDALPIPRADVPRPADAARRPGRRRGSGRGHVLSRRDPTRARGDRGRAGSPPRERHLHAGAAAADVLRSEEHTSELQSPCNLVCRLLLEK